MKNARLGDMVFKRFYTFPSESYVFAADSEKHFWKKAKDKVILLWKNVNAIILFVRANAPI